MYIVLCNFNRALMNENKVNVALLVLSLFPYPQSISMQRNPIQIGLLRCKWPNVFMQEIQRICITFFE